MCSVQDSGGQNRVAAFLEHTVVERINAGI